MRRFESTPEKKLAGMLVLFVFIPLFLLWYVIFFLDKKPGLDTIVVVAAAALLAFYFYSRYKPQIDALTGARREEDGMAPVEEEFEEEQGLEPEEELEEDELEGDLEEEFPAEKAIPKKTKN